MSSIPKMVYTVSNKLQEIFSLFNRSLNLALHRAPLLLFSVEKKKKSFRRIFRLPINLLPKTSLLSIVLSDYMLHVHIDKNGCKSGRLSEECLTCRRCYQTISTRRLTANTGELEFMAWDVMRTIFLH